MHAVCSQEAGTTLAAAQPLSEQYSFHKDPKGGHTYILEQAQHLVVRSIIRDEKPQIGIPKHGRDSYQPRPSTWHDAHILPRILALLALAMLIIVQIRNGLPQRLDAGRGAILARVDADIDVCRPFETTFNLVVDFWRTLP